MEEYFCGGHADSAVSVMVFNTSEQRIGDFEFRWGTTGECTSDGLWTVAGHFAAYLGEKYHIIWKTQAAYREELYEEYVKSQIGLE